MADRKGSRKGKPASPAVTPEKTEEKPSASIKDDPPKAEPPKPVEVEGGQESEEQEDDINIGAAVAGISSWFTSTFSTAKEKSTEMFQYLKQDFTEFSETVSEASKDLKDKLKLEDTAKSAVQSVATKASFVLDQMSTIFGVGPDDDDTIILHTPAPGVVDRVQAKIYSLAIEEDVFLNDPDDIKAYENWLLIFDLEKKNSEMADLMTANPHLQLHYGQLVPDKVSHLVFWHRFYYRVHEICMAEEEKEKAMLREGARKSLGEDKDSDILLDGNDDHSPCGSDPSLVEISEEDQKRLLAEYEEEMKNSSAQHSRQSSETHLSSSSSGSFAMVTHDAATDEVKVE